MQTATVKVEQHKSHNFLYTADPSLLNGNDKTPPIDIAAPLEKGDWVQIFEGNGNDGVTYKTTGAWVVARFMDFDEKSKECEVCYDVNEHKNKRFRVSYFQMRPNISLDTNIEPSLPSPTLHHQGLQVYEKQQLKQLLCFDSLSSAPQRAHKGMLVEWPVKYHGFQQHLRPVGRIDRIEWNQKSPEQSVAEVSWLNPCHEKTRVYFFDLRFVDPLFLPPIDLSEQQCSTHETIGQVMELAFQKESEEEDLVFEEEEEEEATDDAPPQQEQSELMFIENEKAEEEEEEELIFDEQS